MGRKNLLITVTSIISLVISGGFISSPVFAENPVDIEIVEIADDGSGNYVPFQDITNALPGETYSLIPQVLSHSETDISIRVCLNESGQDSSGNPISIPNDTFIININSHWLPDSEANCYKYDSSLNPESLTSPIFEEVTINNAINNEYQNATFNLHIYAEGITGEPDSQDEPSEPDEQSKESSSNITPPSTPSSPDTGFYTFISSALPTISIIAALIMVGTLIFFRRKTK